MATDKERIWAYKESAKVLADNLDTIIKEFWYNSVTDAEAARRGVEVAADWLLAEASRLTVDGE